MKEHNISPSSRSVCDGVMCERATAGGETLPRRAKTHREKSEWKREMNIKSATMHGAHNISNHFRMSAECYFDLIN